jgi:diadenosine tetraphosphate (Ap4A) HIT family hydrolase
MRQFAPPAYESLFNLYHVHVVPRWSGDTFPELYATHRDTQKLMPTEKRAEIGATLGRKI